MFRPIPTTSFIYQSTSFRIEEMFNHLHESWRYLC